MELRPYQQEARAAIENEWQRVDRTLLVLPTGCGKTIVFTAVAADAVRGGGRVLILAHRGELLDQAADKLSRATGLGCSVEKAEQSCRDSWYRVTVGSVQTLMRETRLAAFPPDYFSHIIVDEAHHVLSDGYQRVLEHFSGAKVLGVTATPDRGDRRNLGAFFETLAYEYKLTSAIKDGFLCRISAQTIPLSLDLTGVGVQNGDFKAGALGTALDPYLGQIAGEMAKTCAGRKTVVFLPLIATSRKFTRLLAERGMNAMEVNGESRDRAEVLAAFDAAGPGAVLCNSMLLTEGWDCPSVDCIVVLRPTKVRSLYCQMVGRGTRLSPETGKQDLLLLDFLWHTARHELCRPAHLICESEEVAEKMTKNLEDVQEAMDLEAAETAAESDVIAEREEALAKQLAEMRHRKRALVDPLQFEMSIQAEDLINYIPQFGYQMAPASDKQLAFLEKRGIFPDEVGCAGKAQLLIDRLQKRQDEGLTTPKQIRLLEGRGFRNVGTWDFAAASRLIGRIANNNWRIPAGIDPATYAPSKNEGKENRP